jgi:hypothetical protein
MIDQWFPAKLGRVIEPTGRMSLILFVVVEDMNHIDAGDTVSVRLVSLSGKGSSHRVTATPTRVSWRRSMRPDSALLSRGPFGRIYTQADIGRSDLDDTECIALDVRR